MDAQQGHRDDWLREGLALTAHESQGPSSSKQRKGTAHQRDGNAVLSLVSHSDGFATFGLPTHRNAAARLCDELNSDTAEAQQSRAKLGEGATMHGEGRELRGVSPATARQETRDKDKHMLEKKVRITFTETILGTRPSDPEIHSHYIASKAPDAKSMREEIDALGVNEVEERSITVFSRMEDGTPCLWDYQIKGFFKDACGMLRRVPGTKSSKLTAYKKVIDGLVFTGPRMIPLWMPIDLDLSDTDCQRPLRASTPQGERVALAHSEEAPSKTYIECTIMCLDDRLWPTVKEWLDYGKLRGIGQWRNGGHGTFVWEEV